MNINYLSLGYSGWNHTPPKGL